MSSNQPTFDPLSTTESEIFQMMVGYFDGRRDRPPLQITSPAYEHGRRCGVNDRLNISEPWQHDLARRQRVGKRC